MNYCSKMHKSFRILILGTKITPPKKRFNKELGGNTGMVVSNYLNTKSPD